MLEWCNKEKKKYLVTRKQWTYERTDKPTGEVINKAYTEYRQYELNEKDEKIGNT